MVQYVVWLLFFLPLFWLSDTSQTPCLHRPYADGVVCVCNSTYCDSLEFDLPTNGSILHFATSQSGLRFHPTHWSGVNSGKKHNLMNYINSTINRSETHQKIIGFGGALTGSVAYLLDSMDKELKYRLLEMFFDSSKGLGFSFLRTSIGGCDFDLEPWAYNENPENDCQLTNFTSLDPRDLLKVSILQEISSLIKTPIKLLGTAWSAPKWMKSNNAWTGPSVLKPDFYETWANYHIQYLKLMEQQNITFWGITTGNEPMDGVMWWMFVRFMSMGWSPREQANWVTNFLGPRLRKLMPEIKLLAGDDQRYTFPWWFEKMEQSNPNVMNFIDGFAVHWYLDGIVPPQISLDKITQKYPNKLILNTESCVGDKPLQHHGPLLGSWIRAIMYIEAIFQDLEHSVNGWIDWNILLNEQGGPNYVNNFVDAPVILNSTSMDEMYKQPMFYVLGHFSRFIIPGSIRITSQISDVNVLVLAFLRPDNFTTLIMYNRKKTGMEVHVKDGPKEFKVYLQAESINSLLYFNLDNIPD